MPRLRRRALPVPLRIDRHARQGLQLEDDDRGAQLGLCLADPELGRFCKCYRGLGSRKLIISYVHDSFTPYVKVRCSVQYAQTPYSPFFFFNFFFLKIALRDEFANLTSLPFKIYDVTLHPTVQEDISKCISVFVNLQKGASQSSTL